ncbi:MAG TPA: hypothetical protein VMX74_01140 [Pirellulales bacterium]|nr:hypothetical protein [Pirellulales bacterium]
MSSEKTTNAAPVHGIVILPMCKESVEQEFRDELNDLLKKWGAEIEAEDHYPGYPECGEDVRMTVDIPWLYDEHGNVVRERCEVDLGSSVQAR